VLLFLYEAFKLFSFCQSYCRNVIDEDKERRALYGSFFFESDGHRVRVGEAEESQPDLHLPLRVQYDVTYGWMLFSLTRVSGTSCLLIALNLASLLLLLQWAFLAFL
jgi:hypothetical protein